MSSALAVKFQPFLKAFLASTGRKPFSFHFLVSSSFLSPLAITASLSLSSLNKLSKAKNLILASNASILRAPLFAIALNASRQVLKGQKGSSPYISSILSLIEGSPTLAK